MHTVAQVLFITTANVPATLKTIKASANPVLSRPTIIKTTASPPTKSTTKSTSATTIKIVFEQLEDIMPLAKMARLWWYCATILLWWLFFVTPIHAAAMVDPLKIFWVLTNSSYLGMFVMRFIYTKFVFIYAKQTNSTAKIIHIHYIVMMTSARLYYAH